MVRRAKLRRLAAEVDRERRALCPATLDSSYNPGCHVPDVQHFVAVGGEGNARLWRADTTCTACHVPIVGFMGLHNPRPVIWRTRIFRIFEEPW